MQVFLRIGWPIVVSRGSINLQVSVAKEPYKRENIPQKRPLIFLRTGWPMEWLRSVGSIKLQVSFAEYGLFYMALLQKRPIIFKNGHLIPIE